MVNPRLGCQIVLEPHAQERCLDRGLVPRDVHQMVRKGGWQEMGGGYVDIKSGKWTIRVKVATCIISVTTVFRG